MVKRDMELQATQMLFNDALKLKNMPKNWIEPDYPSTNDNCIYKKAQPKATNHFNWMGDGSDDMYDYCERQYDAWGVLYECDIYLALEDDLNQLVQKYKEQFPNSKVKAEIDGCKSEFFINVSVELDDRDFEEQLKKLGKKTIKNNDGGLVMSERGKEIIGWLQLQERKSYSAREISEGLFCSSRAIPGAMKKLIVDGLAEAEKDGNSPNQYKLTDAGVKIDLNADGDNA